MKLRTLILAFVAFAAASTFLLSLASCATPIPTTGNDAVDEVNAAIPAAVAQAIQNDNWSGPAFDDLSAAIQKAGVVTPAALQAILEPVRAQWSQDSDVTQVLDSVYGIYSLFYGQAQQSGADIAATMQPVVDALVRDLHR